jgi:hypothetical protein
MWNLTLGKNKRYGNHIEEERIWGSKQNRRHRESVSQHRQQWHWQNVSDAIILELY